jgi:hypothetical protein
MPLVMNGIDRDMSTKSWIMWNLGGLVLFGKKSKNVFGVEVVYCNFAAYLKCDGSWQILEELIVWVIKEGTRTLHFTCLVDVPRVLRNKGYSLQARFWNLSNTAIKK